jgi:hypothetical protein
MKPRLVLIFSFLFYSSVICGDTDKSVPVDGYNSLSISTDHYLFNYNLSMIKGVPEDSFYYTPVSHDDSLHQLFHFSGTLGAETGDPLLNTYSTGKTYPNRDHLCSISSLLKVPQVPLSIAYRYRYIDTYSDRFDSLWNQYASETGSRMKKEEIGLAHDHFAEINYHSENLQTNVVFNKYNTWSVTPYYFSPLFTEGYRLLSSLRYSRNRVSVYTNWIRDAKDDYFNHQTPSSTVDISGKAGVEWTFLKLYTGQIQIQYDNQLAPKEALSLYLKRKSERLSSDISLIIYSDRNIAFHLNETVDFLPNLSFLLSGGDDYIQKGKSYLFFQNTIPVKYQTISLHQINLYSSLIYKDTLIFPFKLCGWVQYCSNPIREYVEPVFDTVFIRQTATSNSNRAFAGITGNYTISIRHFTFRLTPVLAFPLENKDNHFTQNKSLDIDLTFNALPRLPAVVTASLIWKDKSSLKYNFITDQGAYLQTFSTPANTSLNFDAKVPFLVPYLNPIVKNTFFIINFGPLRLGSKKRVQEFTLGNQIGPAIYVGIDGMIG